MKSFILFSILCLSFLTSTARTEYLVVKQDETVTIYIEDYNLNEKLYVYKSVYTNPTVDQLKLSNLPSHIWPLLKEEFVVYSTRYAELQNKNKQINDELTFNTQYIDELKGDIRSYKLRLILSVVILCIIALILIFKR